MTVNYTTTGMQSLLDSYDSGTSSANNFELDLNAGTNTKGLIMVQGAMRLTGASTANVAFYMRSSSNSSSNWFNHIQTTGTTNSYYWTSGVPYIYTTYYRIQSNNTYQMQMMIDCENNGTSSPVKRINIHTDAFGYTQYGNRFNIQDASRVTSVDPYKIYMYVTSGSIYTKFNSYAITGK